MSFFTPVFFQRYYIKLGLSGLHMRYLILHLRELLLSKAPPWFYIPIIGQKQHIIFFHSHLLAIISLFTPYICVSFLTLFILCSFSQHSYILGYKYVHIFPSVYSGQATRAMRASTGTCDPSIPTKNHPKGPCIPFWLS